MSSPQIDDRRLSNILEKIAIGALSFLLMLLWTDISKMEEKVERLQTNSFTTDNARILEDRVMKNIDGVRVDIKNLTGDLRQEMNGKLDLLIKMQTENPSRR